MTETELTLQAKHDLIEFTAVNVSLRALLLETLPEEMLAPVAPITI
jgi:hypothetical protein